MRGNTDDELEEVGDEKDRLLHVGSLVARKTGPQALRRSWPASPTAAASSGHTPDLLEIDLIAAHCES